MQEPQIGSTVSSWSARGRKKKEKKSRKATTTHALALGRNGTRTRTMFPGIVHRIVRDEVPLVVLQCTLGLDPWSVTRQPMPLRGYRQLECHNVADHTESTIPMEHFTLPLSTIPECMDGALRNLTGTSSAESTSQLRWGPELAHIKVSCLRRRTDRSGWQPRIYLMPYAIESRLSIHA